VANLLLARGATRSREMSVRAALGAGRGRLVRQLMTESFMLAAVGCALGLVLSLWGIQLFRSVIPSDFPRVDTLGIDAKVAGYALVVSVVAGLVFGTAPAVQVTRGKLSETLAEGGRGGSSGVRHRRLRTAFVVGEVALAQVLLISAGLMIKGALRMQLTPLGFEPDRTLAFGVTLGQREFLGRPSRLLEGMPELEDAGLAPRKLGFGRGRVGGQPRRAIGTSTQTLVLGAHRFQPFQLFPDRLVTGIVEVLRDEKFVLYLRVDRFGYLIARCVVLFEQKPALIRLREIPDIKEREGIEAVFKSGAEMRILIRGVQRTVRRISFLPVIRKVDRTGVNKQVPIKEDITFGFLREQKAQGVAPLREVLLEPCA
jgi:hypothetical protein